MEGYRETRAGAVECQEQQFSEAEAVMGRRSAMEAAASEGVCSAPSIHRKGICPYQCELVVAQLHSFRGIKWTLLVTCPDMGDLY